MPKIRSYDVRKIHFLLLALCSNHNCEYSLHIGRHLIWYSNCIQGVQECFRYLPELWQTSRVKKSSSQIVYLENCKEFWWLKNPKIEKFRIISFEKYFIKKAFL